MIFCLDANTLITAWNVVYRPNVFPTLYLQMEKKLPGNIILIKSIYDEIEPVSVVKSDEKLQEEHPVRFWLQKTVKIPETPIDSGTRSKSLELMNEYEINDGPKGADNTDIQLISFALLKGHTVVTLEGRQEQKPGKKSSYKIPLICEAENVECIDFITLLEKLNIRI